jgi:hypothetical protein
LASFSMPARIFARALSSNRICLAMLFFPEGSFVARCFGSCL